MASPLGRGSFPLFTFKGIKVGLHWSFLALPAYIIISDLNEGQPWPAIGMKLALVGVVFVCVVLHEFGHALTARRYGVGTRDIILLPIGGVASLERMPEEPKQEFLITLAGPLVNLVIAAIALLAMAVLGLTSLMTDLLDGTGWASLLAFVFAVNVGLFLFNLIPAFPMDGGRLLRSLLAMRMQRDKATRIATTIGRVLAVGFIVYAIYMSQPFTALIGIFVYLAAGAEARQSAQRELLRGIAVNQVMRTRFVALPGSTTVRLAVGELMTAGDAAAVVQDGHALIGVVDRAVLITAIEGGRAEALLSELPLHAANAVAPADDANQVIQRMALARLPLVPVVQDGTLVGVVDAANVQALLDLRRAAEGRG